MQNLILTSTGFNSTIQDKFLELVDISKEKIKVVFIPTAAITKEQKEMIPVCKSQLLKAGIVEENIITYDLDRSMGCDEICTFHAVYVCGGNPQYLLNKMNTTKFYIPLKKFLANNGVYIGVSAGSIVAAKNLPNNLGYINCVLNVHAKEGSEYGDIDTSDCPNIKLTDNQSIIITNERVTII